MLCVWRGRMSGWRWVWQEGQDLGGRDELMAALRRWGHAWDWRGTGGPVCGGEGKSCAYNYGHFEGCSNRGLGLSAHLMQYPNM